MSSSSGCLPFLSPDYFDNINLLATFFAFSSFFLGGLEIISESHGQKKHKTIMCNKFFKLKRSHNQSSYFAYKNRIIDLLAFDEFL